MLGNLGQFMVIFWLSLRHHCVEVATISFKESKLRCTLSLNLLAVDLVKENVSHTMYVGVTLTCLPAEAICRDRLLGLSFSEGVIPPHWFASVNLECSATDTLLDPKEGPICYWIYSWDFGPAKTHYCKLNKLFNKRDFLRKS